MPNTALDVKCAELFADLIVYAGTSPEKGFELGPGNRPHLTEPILYIPDVTITRNRAFW